MVKIYSIFVFLTIYLYGEIYALKIAENEIDEVIVSMGSGVEVVHEKLRARTYMNREDRLNSVYDALTKHRDSSQKPLLDYLISKKVKHDSLWISNQIYIPNCDADLLEQIKKFPGISDVQRNEYFKLEEPIVGENEPSIQWAEWGVAKIQAPDAWNLGWKGAGCKVGVIDTGARYTHIVIRDNYVGTANYGWRDPYNNAEQPYDGNGHGTHCTGTIVGGEMYGAGVAPGAQWMACKGCNDAGSCGMAELKKCAQFMLCPTDSMGNNPNCTKAPNVISNSWAFDTTGWFDAAMQGWYSAGIVGVFALGNSGPSCSTGYYPGTSIHVIGVGATTDTDALASFSSKGPAVGTGIIKPDISAPGQYIRSAYTLNNTE